MQRRPEKVPLTPGKVLRKISVLAMERFLTPDLVRHGFFASRQLRDVLETLPKDENQPWKMVKDHLWAVGGRLHLLANIEHPDTWMRDTKYTLEFIKNPLIHDQLLKTLERKQRRSGQIPTAVGVWGETSWHWAEDESTITYITSAGELARSDRKFITEDRRQKIMAAAGFINEHVIDGRYISPAGDRRGTIDAFVYPEDSTVTHIQGLYVIALMWLSDMGFNTATKEIKLAKEKYQSQAKYDYLPLNDTFPLAPDATALYADYLAMTFFDESLLPDRIAANTYFALPWSKHGIKILTQSPNGEAFPYQQFIVDRKNGPYHPGFYQNAGTWLFWHNNSLVTAALHGVPVPKNFREDTNTLLRKTDFAEHIRTGGIYESILTPKRPFHAWNAAIETHQKSLDK